MTQINNRQKNNAKSNQRNKQKPLDQILDDIRTGLRTSLQDERTVLHLHQIGSVRSIDSGVAWVDGLAAVQSEELVRFSLDVFGLAYNLDRDGVGIILLDAEEALQAGDIVHRTGRVTDVPVGESLLGRIVDALGRPLDEGGPLQSSERRPVERPAPEIMDRAPVTVPLQTGIKVIDALIPIGRGQRELIVGDRQTGKTAIAVDTIINQRDTDVVCVYCAIGQRKSAVADVVSSLRTRNAFDNTIVVTAGGDDPPGLRFIAPYAATTIAESFMQEGRDALIVYDDLTQHARAYRELSLLLRRPPGREAYPGDIFYIHSRLLERATHLREELGDGSLTALPIIETQAQNISAYIPTNLISITDGQIYLSPGLFQKGIMPAVDVGRSVSRVGGKTQLPAYQAVAGDLRLSYTQFMELETFARFGTRLDEETERTLRRGRRIREVLQQPQYEPMPVPEQIAVLLAVSEGAFDRLPLERIVGVEEAVRKRVSEELPDLSARLARGERFEEEDRKKMLDVACSAISSKQEKNEHGNA
jgi:F-type H+/Na+-transporting ATPase subunit alpha